MGDIGDCLREPPDPASPATLAWARKVSREVQAAPPDVPAYLAALREFAEGRELASGGRYYPRTPQQPCPRAPRRPADPAAEIKAVLREYDEAVAAGDFTLPDAPARAPGTCEYCSGPVGRTGGTVCRYCKAEGTERLTADTRYPVPELRDDHPLRQLAPPSVRARRGIPVDAVVKGIAAGLLVAIVLMTLATLIGRMSP